jgi:hypothetical protein
LIDGSQSIGTVRSAFADGLLYSIVTSSEGFKVVADSEDGARLYASIDYPNLSPPQYPQLVSRSPVASRIRVPTVSDSPTRKPPARAKPAARRC